MKDLSFRTRLSIPYAEAVPAVHDALAAEGFGVLTEIDIAKVMKAKLDVDMPPQVILGACRPELAYAALQANPAVAALLPCNVVIRAVDGGTLVEAIDPAQMLGMAMDGADLGEMAEDATARIRRAVEALANAYGAV